MLFLTCETSLTRSFVPHHVLNMSFLVYKTSHNMTQCSVSMPFVSRKTPAACYSDPNAIRDNATNANALQLEVADAMLETTTMFVTTSETTATTTSVSVSETTITHLTTSITTTTPVTTLKTTTTPVATSQRTT